MQSAKQISEVDHIVGARVREARRALSMTQSDLAGLTGRSSQQIQKYESGENRISAGLLFDLSIVLKQPISWFFGNELHQIRTDNENVVSEFDTCLELLYTFKNTQQLPLIKGFLEMINEKRESIT